MWHPRVASPAILEVGEPWVSDPSQSNIHAWCSPPAYPSGLHFNFYTLFACHPSPSFLPTTTRAPPRLLRVIRITTRGIVLVACAHSVEPSYWYLVQVLLLIFIVVAPSPHYLWCMYEYVPAIHKIIISSNSVIAACLYSAVRVPEINYRPAIKKVPNTMVMLTFGQSLRKLDLELVLSGERYNQSYIIAYARGC